MYTTPEVYEFISKQTEDPIIEWKTCAISGAKFAIFQSDLDFYKKLSPVIAGTPYPMPLPTLCPEERFRRRLSHRHETQLYFRTCDLTGQNMISAYSTDKPYKVYDQSVYRSDQWDPTSYGIPYDSNKSFFEQYKDLQLKVPRLNLLVDMRNVNSKYVNQANMIKNCYMVWGAVEDDQCFYGYRTINSNHCVDNTFASNCDYCYECVDVDKCYNCNYVYQSDSCQNSSFLYSCRNCEFCFMCTNLYNKKYCYKNKQLTKEEYEQLMQRLFNGSYVQFQQHQKEFETLKQQSVHKAINNTNVQNCYGHLLRRSKDSSFCFASWDLTRCRYTYVYSEATDCHSVCYGWSHNELIYDSITVGENSFKSAFCTDSRNIQDCYYCDTVINCKHCFGCIGLNQKEYCIFNKQYSKKKYEKEVGKIIGRMKKAEERGEFFPPTIAPISYNESAAQFHFPLQQNEAQERGLQRTDIHHTIDVPEGMNVISEVPDNIADIDESILKQAIICNTSQRPFRIQPQELEFYKKKNLPLPRKHYDTRNIERMNKKEPWTLNINTDEQNNSFLSAYPSDTAFQVDSEEKYNKEIYG